MAPLGQLLLGLAALGQVWLRRWLVRAGLGLGLGLAALHLLLNKVALPLANRQLLPGLLAEAEALSLREVRPQQTHSEVRPQQTHSEVRPQQTHSEVRPQQTHSSSNDKQQQ
jgi:hypothetical protein